MLGFKRKPERFWIGLDHKIFDDSELGDRPKSEREKVRFQLYPLTRQLLRDVQDDNTEIDYELVVESGTRKKVKIETTNNEGQNDDIIDKILVGWEGVVDMDTGEEIPCTRENKLALMEGYPVLGSKWMEAARFGLAKYDKFIEEEKEKTVKNSQPTLDGSGVGKKK